MASLTQQQVDELRQKGMPDEKIRAIAAQKGLDMPSTSTTASVVGALTKSERGFGQSIAGALGGSGLALGDVKQNIDTANQLNSQVKTNLIQAIKDKRARGEDTSRLLSALKTMDKEVNFYDILNSSTGNSLNKTATQVFGEGLGVVTDVAGAGALPGGVGQIAKANTFMQGVKAGAKSGAIGGGIFGAAQGATRAAQDNASAGSIVGSGIAGGVTGAVTGGVLGGTLGGVSGWVRGRQARLSQKEQAFLEDLVAPKPTAAVKEQALREGRVTEQGLLSASRITPSKRDLQLAEAVRGVVSPKNTTLQNIQAIDNTVQEINSGVKAYVKANKVPFNTNQLKSQLNAGKDELRLIFASDTTAEKTYNAVVDEFLKHVKSKDTAGLLDARQVVDKIPAVKKLLDSRAIGENVKKEVVLTVRSQANKYIASLLPKGNAYRATLLRESQMIEALGNIAEKNTKQIGVNKLQALTTKYPVLKGIIGGAALTYLGLKGIGVGSSLIGSTD